MQKISSISIVPWPLSVSCCRRCCFLLAHNLPDFLQVPPPVSPASLPPDADAMAKSKSTTTPTKASSSKTKDQGHVGDSRSNVYTRSTSVQTSPSKRKADDDHAVVSRSSKRRAVADNSLTSSTSQKAIPIRAASSKGKGKEVVTSEIELFKERHTSLFPRGVTVKVEGPDPDNICVRTPAPDDSDERQKLLDFVLIEEFGSEARRLAVDKLFQASRRSAASETDFGFTYIKATVSRLRRKGIEEPRLVEVVAMLQDGLMGEFRARLDSLGGPLASPVPLTPSPPGARQVTAVTIPNANPNGTNDVLQSRSSQHLPVVVPHNSKGRSARSESPSKSSDSSSDDDAPVVPGSQKTINYRDDDNEEYIENKSRVARCHEHLKHEDGMTSFSADKLLPAVY
jgi:hypothetical protein